MQLVVKLSDLSQNGSNASLGLNVSVNSEQKTVTVSASNNLYLGADGNTSNNRNKTYKYNTSPAEVIPEVEADFGFTGLVIE